MFENVKEALRARIRPSSTHLTALRGDLQSRLRHFKAERTQEQQKPLEEDFAQVLLAWGIGEQDIPAVLRELRLRRWVFVLPVAVCLLTALVTGQTTLWLALALVVPPCLFGIASTYWRISVLTCRCFQPFRRWLGCWLCSLLMLSKKGA